MKILKGFFVLALIFGITAPAFAMWDDGNPFQMTCMMNGGVWTSVTNEWGGSSGTSGYCSYGSGGLFGATGDWYFTDYDGRQCGYTLYNINGFPTPSFWGDPICRLRHSN